MWRAYQTLSGATGMLVLSVCRGSGRSVVRGAILAPADNEVHGRRSGAHVRPKDLRPGVLPYLLSKPEAALSLSGHAQYPEYR